jgi:glycosyltransferase involved in cell wall biosynthesis
MDIKISLIVPVYNVENYIKKCLDSILNQPFKEFELIVVNDGSTDKSLDILKNYESKYDNIISINKQNEGQGVARNMALDICKGEYIAFIDSDDYIEPNMLISMYNKSLEEDLDIVICNYKIVNINGDRVRYENIVLNDNEIIDNIECIKRFLVTNKIEGFSWNKFFKKKLFEMNNIRYPKGMKYEDIPTVLSLIINAKRVGFINNELYNYLLRDDSTTSTHTIGNMQDYIKAICMIGKKLECNCNVFEKEYEYYYSKRITNSVWGFLKTNNNKEENILFANNMIGNINRINKFQIFIHNAYFKKIEAIKIVIKIYLYKKYVNRNKLNS